MAMTKLLPQAQALGVWITLFAVSLSSAGAGESQPNVYVILWLDTEDYILPQSDDAALRVADLLTKEQVRATFKVVGEKARTLERRGRGDVIAALNKHEIGYHSNFHSVQPTPAMYLSKMGWDEGVNEFNRRERPGLDDVRRIFGRTPTCYGQPGSSWAPQAYGAMNRWKMGIYLDGGNHVDLEGRPCYYCGVLNLYKLTHMIRANLANPDLREAEERFLTARRSLLAEGGGIVSICYHPCEFVHKKFWDGVNFQHGANPPREQWKLPPMKSAEETRIAYQVLEEYVRFIKHFPDVRFITASQAGALYRDRAKGRHFTSTELRAAARTMTDSVSFQRGPDTSYALTASELFILLHDYIVLCTAGSDVGSVDLSFTPFGPCDGVTAIREPVTVDRSQFLRTVTDVRGFLHTQGRVPSTVWLGSVSVSPESYFIALTHVAADVMAGKALPETIEIKPAKLGAAAFVADDNPNLWRWVIFPPGFHAPALMDLAKRQAWALKPAILAQPDRR
jgi:hypothetical protein